MTTVGRKRMITRLSELARDTLRTQHPVSFAKRLDRVRMRGDHRRSFDVTAVDAVRRR